MSIDRHSTAHDPVNRTYDSPYLALAMIRRRNSAAVLAADWSLSSSPILLAKKRSDVFRDAAFTVGDVHQDPHYAAALLLPPDEDYFLISEIDDPATGPARHRVVGLYTTTG